MPGRLTVSCTTRLRKNCFNLLLLRLNFLPMRLKFFFFIFLSILLSPALPAQQKTNRRQTPFRVVGYYFLQAAETDSANAASDYSFLDKITHLNIAFINPDAAGNFKQELAIDALINKAHRKGVKVLASIAGGGPHPYYKTLLQAENRSGFVANLVSLVTRYNLDGIDVDLEGGDIDRNYGNFVTALAAALAPQRKLMTAAIATAYKDQLPDNALQAFDFVNVMSYDRTGPWRPDKPGDHAPYAMAADDLDYWHNIRAVPKEKLGLGLPFYGYGFGAADSSVVSMTYNEIASLYPNQESDTLLLPGNVTMYYNNKATIKKKTRLALQQAGGVMVWQLLGDATAEASLLETIHQAIHKKEKAARPEN